MIFLSPKGSTYFLGDLRQACGVLDLYSGHGKTYKYFSHSGASGVGIHWIYLFSMSAHGTFLFEEQKRVFVILSSSKTMRK